MKNIKDFIIENMSDGYAVVVILPGRAGNFEAKSLYTNDNIEYNDRHPGASIEDTLEDLFDVDFADIIEYDFEQLPQNKANQWIEKRTEELMKSAQEKYEKHIYK